MEILFGALVIFAFWAFSRTPAAEEPVQIHNPDHEPSGGTKAAIAALVAIGMMMALGALAGGGAMDTNTYADVRASGGADAVAMLAGFDVLIGLALMLMIGGFLLKVSFGLFLVALVGSVMFVAMMGA